MNKPWIAIILIFWKTHTLFAQTIIRDSQFANAIKKECPNCIDDNKQLLMPTTSLLRKLNVDSSGIKDLSGIEAFINLDTLACRFNPLKVLPNNLPKGLKVLYCANDSLTQLGALPPMLKFLDCSKNDLTLLTDLPVLLTSLDCSSNNLKTVSLLPKNLTYLNCSNNKITTFETLSQSLQIFICDHNSITELPVLSQELQTLICNNNRISNISNLPNVLKKLDCRANQLTKAPKLPFNLEEFLCRGNPQIKCLTNMPDLVQVDTILPICPQTIYERVEITDNKTVKYHTINLVPYRKKSKWGYATFEGNVVIPPQYDYVQFFKSRNECKTPLAIVTVEKLKGLIDNIGDFVLKPEYEDIQCSDYWGFIVLKNQNSNWFYLTKDGFLIEDTLKVISALKTGQIRNIGQALMVEEASDKEIKPYIFYQNQAVSFSKYNKIANNLWRMTDTIPPSKYDSLVFTTPYTDILFAKKGNEWGVINTKQELLIPFSYDNIVKQFYNYSLKDSTNRVNLSLVKANKKGLGWGIISTKDLGTIPFIFDSIDIIRLPDFVRPSDTVTQQKLFFKVKNEQNQWGIMDIYSKWLVFCQYAKIESDKKNGFKLYKDDKVGFYNPRTNVTIQPIYKSIRVMTKGVLEVITVKDKLGYIDDFGNEYFEDEF